MEEKENREQLEQEISNVQEGIVEIEDKGTTLGIEDTSSLGKFKDAESMLKAYNNLQAEFTRKCQKLSEISKKLEDAENSQKAENSPVYNSDTWKDDVSAFLTQNEEAKAYANEIANEIMNDKRLQLSPDALELAWARIMKREYALPKNLAQNDDFINNQILSQENVKERVLNEYFTNIQKTKTPPVIARSGVVATLAEKEPTNLAEAKLLVEKLFNLKG